MQKADGGEGSTSLDVGKPGGVMLLAIVTLNQFGHFLKRITHDVNVFNLNVEPEREFVCKSQEAKSR